MTLIINLFGAPGAGKSTTAAGVFYFLKLAGKNVEYVPEVAKAFTWEKRSVSLSCQPYVFGKQFRDMFRLIGQVEAIVTDSPVFLSAFYMWKYPNDIVDAETFMPYVIDQAKMLGGYNYFLNRTKDYNPKGRNQTAEESDQFSKEMKYLLQLHDIPYTEMDGNADAVDQIVRDTLRLL
jgi:hypothetical protein